VIAPSHYVVCRVYSEPPPPRKPFKGGGIITGEGAGDGPSAGLLVGAAGPAADASTRAAAIAGAMLGVLAALVSLMWALYKCKPGLITAGAGAPAGARPPASVDQTQGNQETPLLPVPADSSGPATGYAAAPTSEPLQTSDYNGPASGHAAPPTPGSVQTSDVDLANYFSPMSTTTTKTTMNRGVQADLDSGAGWTVASALATHASFEEVSKSRGAGLSGAGDGTGTMNVGTQTANQQAAMAGQSAPTSGSAVYSAYSSRTVTDTTRDNIQVRKSSAFW